jgi:hypothetical protein
MLLTSRKDAPGIPHARMQHWSTGCVTQFDSSLEGVMVSVRGNSRTAMRDRRREGATESGAGDNSLHPLTETAPAIDAAALVTFPRLPLAPVMTLCHGDRR